MPNYDSPTNDVQLWKFLLDRPDRVDDFQGLLGSAAGRRKALYLLESFSNHLDRPSTLERKFADRLDDNLPWIDDVGRSLEDYPRPSLAVDTAVLTVPEPNDIVSSRSNPEIDESHGLHVLLVRSESRSGKLTWALPGTFIHPGETLRAAAIRALRDKAGIHGLEPQQLHVFDRPNRDHRGWVISVGHLEVVSWDAIVESLGSNPLVSLKPVNAVINTSRPLPFDHGRIVEAAVQRVRQDYSLTPDPARLLNGPFSLRELEILHRRIDPDGTPPKDTFRRRMQEYLEETGELSSGSLGKPARLFNHRRKNH